MPSSAKAQPNRFGLTAYHRKQEERLSKQIRKDQRERPMSRAQAIAQFEKLERASRKPAASTSS